MEEKNQKKAKRTQFSSSTRPAKRDSVKDDCPLCSISEETLVRLREADKNKKLKNR